METQVRNRRDDARAINERCDAIENMLERLKGQSLEYKALLAGEDETTPAVGQTIEPSTDVRILSQADLVAWAEEVKPASQ